MLALKPHLPFIVRLDGHRFSKFTVGFTKPFDKRICDTMIYTTADLVNEFSATTGYTQSDEITLVFGATCAEPGPSAEPQKQIEKGTKKQYNMIFNGRTEKIVSLMAGFCSVRFSYHLSTQVGNDEKLKQKIFAGYFDARAIQMSEPLELSTNILGRMNDCKRNSKNNLAHCHFSKDEVEHLNQQEVVEKLQKEKSIKWEDMPKEYQWGSFLKRGKFEKQGKNPLTGESVVATRSKMMRASIDIVQASNSTDDFLLQKCVNDCPNFKDHFKTLDGKPLS